MKKTLIVIFTFILIFFAYMLLLPLKNTANAFLPSDGSTNGFKAWFCNSNAGTVWQVRYYFTFTDGSTTAESTIYTDLPGDNINCPGTQTNFTNTGLQLTNSVPSTLTWGTICVDPPNAADYVNEFPSYTAYYWFKDVSYAGANNLGTVNVSHDSWVNAPRDCPVGQPTPPPPSCPSGFTLCPNNTCYQCPGGFNLNCSTSPPSCTPITVIGAIQGYKVTMPGNNGGGECNPVAGGAGCNQPWGATVSIDGGYGDTENPYGTINKYGLVLPYWKNLASGSTHTVSVPPLSGYNTGYTLCYNSTTCHSSSPTPGNSATVTIPSTSPYYVDLWWHYYPRPSNLTVSVPSCSSTGTYTANFSWTTSGTGWWLDITSDSTWATTNQSANSLSNGSTSYSKSGLNTNTSYYWRIWPGIDPHVNAPTSFSVPDCPRYNDVRVIIDNNSNGKLDAGESFGTPNVNFSSSIARIDQNSTRGLFNATSSIGTNGFGGPWNTTYSDIQYLVTPASGWQLTKYSSNKNLVGSPACNANTTCDYSSGWTRSYSPASGETLSFFLGIKPLPTATPTTAPTATPTTAPTPVPCAVTTSPASLSLIVGGATGTVTASVTSGLGGASITRMRFGSYDTAISTVNPTSDTTSVYSTAVTAVAGGSTAIWATADLSDGRTCQAPPTADTNITVSGPTSTPTPTTAPPSTVTIQGHFKDQSGADLGSNIGQGVTITNGATNYTTTYNTTPTWRQTFWNNSLSPANGYTVTATNVAGYTLSYSSCVNCTTHTTYTSGNSVTAINLPTGGNYADIYFKYTPTVTSTPTPTPTPTLAPLPTPAPGTNLTVTNVTTNKSSYIPNEVMQITSTVRNSGTTNISTPFFVAYNTNGPVSAPVCLSGWSGYDIFSLNSGVSDIRTTPRSAPVTLGTYQVGVSADNNPCQITESNEADNYLRSAPYTVIAANYNLYVNSLVTKRGTDCASGVTTNSFAHGDSVVVCFTEGNNGTTATVNNFLTNLYRNRSAQPAYGTMGEAIQTQGPYEAGYVINNTSVGFFIADSSVCTSCNAAVFIDSGNINSGETSELDNFASVPYTVSLPTYTISGNVFIDTNNNGVQDCNGLCDDGLGDELNYSLHTSVGRDGTGSPLTTTTDGAGSYSFSSLAGSSNYTITLTVPPGYKISNGGVNTRSVDVTTADVPNQDFGILFVPTHNVGGDVFVDDGTGCTPASTCAGDTIRDGTEPTVIDPTTVKIISGVDCSGTVVASSTTSTGTFSIGSIPEGDYLVCMTDPPSGYEITSPTTGPPPFIPVTVGATDVTGVDFGVLPFGRWIQSSGTDIRDDSGGSDTSTFIPPSAADGGTNTTNPTTGWTGPGTNNGNTGGSNGGGSGIGNSTCNASGGTSGSNYASTNGGAGGAGSPGIIFSGNNAANFGAGFASSTNWKVGSSSYPDTYTPKNYATSYAYVSGRVTQLGITRTTITPATCGGSLANCNLNSMNAGVYDVGNLTINNFNGGAGGIFSSAKKIIILVNGNLLIKSNIIVPIGSTLTFIVSGDITIDRSIGTTWDSAASQVEGFYSADKNFYIDGDPIVCSLTADRLNMEGSIIVNAGGTGGRFVNNRTLCTKNAFCPVFTISERPDFVLNSPESIKQVRTIYQEVAP